VLTERSSLKNNLRIRNPFEDDPTPTKKPKLSNDVIYHIPTIDRKTEDIHYLTTPQLPHMDKFLWGMEGERYT
jgi:hypothetical protein